MPRPHDARRGALRVRAIAITLVALATAAFAPAQSQPLRVLFIGNSYTYVNDMPAVLKHLAAAAHEPRALEPRGILIGGYTFEHHIKDDSAGTLIERGGPWDWVVLQEQSERPLIAPATMWRDVTLFAGAVKSAGAKVLLYETWAREATPNLQDSLSRSYHHAAALTGATVAHVGEAWAAFRATESVTPPAHSALFQNDGSHPSPEGTYLAACVFYATLYGKSPVGLPAEGIPAARAKEVQALAWKASRR